MTFPFVHLVVLIDSRESRGDEPFALYHSCLNSDIAKPVPEPEDD